MADWQDLRRLVRERPESDEVRSRGSPAWRLRGKAVVGKRPLAKADLAALGDDALDGAILGAHVPDEGAKFALCADRPDVYFTTPHFNGYPAVLVRLDAIDE